MRAVLLAFCVASPGTAAGAVSIPAHAPQTARAAHADPFAGASLRFDGIEKTVQVPSGQTDATFTFAVTNVSATNVTVSAVLPSCGCTAAKLPPLPWTLAPSHGGIITANMNLAGKYGTVIKSLTVVSDAGTFPLTLRAAMAEDAYQNLQRNAERSRNLQIAAADRQVVFRGDCARCHVEPTKGKVGKELYTAACGICHDSPHRASMVPALRGRPVAFPAVYWNQWILHGKEGSLMPAFAHAKGGPLSQEQSDSLTAYLTGEFLKEPAPEKTPAPSTTPAAIK
jgi:mono/diheme cytochrome c family protein